MVVDGDPAEEGALPRAARDDGTGGNGGGKAVHGVHDLQKTAWEELWEKCEFQGLPFVKPGKDWNYLRYKVWANFVTGVKTKLDNRKKTGSKGGPEAELKEWEEVMRQVIGRDSPSSAVLESRTP